jgi:hypothetical protein
MYETIVNLKRLEDELHFKKLINYDGEFESSEEHKKDLALLKIANLL